MPMQGVHIFSTAELTTIELNTCRCKWAIGRIVFLISCTFVWLVVSFFFWACAASPNGSIESGVFSILFLLCFLLTLISCIAAFGSEQINISRSNLIFKKRILVFTWKKHIEREAILAVVLGHVSTPGEDVSSIETVTIIYNCKSKKKRKSLIIGYLLDKNYRTYLYDILLKELDTQTASAPFSKAVF